MARAICRYCRGSDRKLARVTCRCRGSLALAHRECLEAAVRAKQGDTQCDVCRQPYSWSKVRIAWLSTGYAYLWVLIWVLLVTCNAKFVYERADELFHGPFRSPCLNATQAEELRVPLSDTMVAIINCTQHAKPKWGSSSSSSFSWQCWKATHCIGDSTITSVAAFLFLLFELWWFARLFKSSVRAAIGYGKDVFLQPLRRRGVSVLMVPVAEPRRSQS